VTTGVDAPDAPAAILSWLEEKPTLARTAAAVRRFDRLSAEQPGLFTRVAALVLRNYTIEPLEPLLKLAAYREGLELDLRYSGYEPGAPDTLAKLAEDAPDAVIVALRLEELSPALSEDFRRDGAGDLAGAAVDFVVSLVRGVRERSGAAILVHNFVTPHAPAFGLADTQDPQGQVNLVRAMNVDVAARVSAIEGAHVVDVDLCFARVGLVECLDARGARTSGAPLSQAALRALADAQVRHLRALRGARVKCVVVDCDNTLWGGVVGEDGLEGIVLGEHGPGLRHRELQRSLANLRRRGVVLAIASKNEEADVLAVLAAHPDCLLRESDFAAHRINWEDKATNVEAIAAELNLGLEHLMFIDDNPAECEWVRTRLPGVRVVQWPGDLPPGTALDELAVFDSLLITEEDRRRTEMYQAEAQRRASREEVTSIDDYLRSLEMVARVGRARREHLARVTQLLARTNQFNLTTRRHDAGTVQRMHEDPAVEIIWVDLQDRFGASGVVGCGIVRVEGDAAVIDTLLQSCRVIGRGVEAVMVNRLGELAREHGASALVGEFIPSARNQQVADLYPRLGFAGPEQDADTQRWRWDLAGGVPPAPDWMEIVHEDGS
jgi:FkbH-like protein